VVHYGFLTRMLKPRFHFITTFFTIMIFYRLVDYINIDMRLYQAFPQEIFFILTSMCMIIIMFKGTVGKKIMVCIFMDSLGYISSFIFLPLSALLSREVINNELLYNRVYAVCDVLTLILYSLILVWVVRNYRNLKGEISIAENLYLLILSFFIRQSITYYGNNLINSESSLTDSLLVTLVAIAGTLLLISSLYYVDRRLKLALAKQKNSFLEKKITIWQEEEKQLACFRHDFKNHMLCLKSLLQDNKVTETMEYLNALTHSEYTVFSSISTGNVYADAVLREKLLLAGNKNIKIDTDLILPPTPLIPALELCIILSNALDNALEACQRITGENLKHVIKASSYVRRFCLFLEITNPVHEDLRNNNGFFQSSKKEKELHGIGLSNVRKAVENCNGTLSLSVSEGIFYFSVMLPLTPERQMPAPPATKN
jgi:sensor histidine kinase YesM